MRHRASASRHFITIAPVVTGCLFLLASGPTYADDTPIPLLSAWESNMTTFGRQICNKLVPGAEDWSLQFGDIYYDGERVYYQIATYTGDPTWKYCAGLAESIYRDGYVIPNNGKLAGYDDFTSGLLMDYERTGDTTSRDTVVLISQNASFASDGTPLEWTADTSSSREVAYVIMAYLNAESAGAPRRARLADMVNQALGHIDQWFVSKTAPYVRPFMVGITMQALIQAYGVTHDSRIPNAVKTALDGLMPGMWLPDSKCFKYTNVVAADGTGDMSPAPDLNLVIAPAYAWMYYVTGDTKYRDLGDQIFAGGVTNAQNWLYLGKQFDQSYWWSPAYVTWRKAAQPGVPSGIVPTTTSTGTDPSVSMANMASTPPPPSIPSKTLTVITAPTIPSSDRPTEQTTGKFLGKLKKLMDRVR
jgi:hypothetical protein